ncbi:MAG: type I-E CRISPR-associated protein Cas6/Cse3/CasE [Rhodoblastus sp.]
MRLHMLRLDPDFHRVAAWGRTHRVSWPEADPGYLWHALLTATFGALAPKPWRLVEPPRGRAHILGYVEADKAALEDHARSFADPAAAAAIGLATLETKQMPDRFAAGRRLGFEVRLRSVVRSNLAPDGAGGRTGRVRAEIDAALHAALAAREADAAAPRPEAEQIYRTWLAERLNRGGAHADTGAMQLLWRKRAAIVRRNAERAAILVGRKGGGPDIGLAGVLEVTDETTFQATLARGVGRHRAFGFGMLLLRPA